MIRISHTSTSVARSCWQKYKWKYVDKLYPIHKAIPLTLGDIIHKGFYLYYTGTSDGDTLSFIKSRFDSEIAKAELADVEPLRIAQATAMGMWVAYPHKNLSEFSSVSAEHAFSVRLRGINGVRLEGRADGLVGKNNALWVRELKTTGLGLNQFRQRTDVSTQASFYTYGMQEYKPMGVMYDLLKKPTIRKRAQETCGEFCDRIIESYKADSRLPEGQRMYYARVYTHRNPVQLRHFENDMITYVRELRSRLNSKKFYRNPDSCWNFNSECSYKKICFQEKPDELTLQLYFTQGGSHGRQAVTNK